MWEHCNLTDIHKLSQSNFIYKIIPIEYIL
jgi:hypothetical protein